jgi:hypothetical protein
MCAHGRATLVASGLLRLDRERETASFLHLTFQEYFLARALANAPLADTLMSHWHSPCHEKTLALLLARMAKDDAAKVDAVLGGLVEWGLKTHRHSRGILWGLGRSPLRVALYLVARSGMDLERLPGVERVVMEGLERESLMRSVLAVGAGMPLALLAGLANGTDENVHMGVAETKGVLPTPSRPACPSHERTRLQVYREAPAASTNKGS